MDRRKHRSTISPQKPIHIEVEHLLSTLNELVRGGSNNNKTNIFLKEGRVILESLRDVTKSLDNLEKSYIISYKGALSILIQCLCFCGKRSINNNDIVIEICTYLIDNSHQDSRLFCKMILDHLSNDIECIGISDSLTKIINSHSIRSIFVHDLCIPKLLEIYYKCSISLSKLNIKPYSSIYINPTTNTPVTNNNNIATNINNNNRNGNIYNIHCLTTAWDNGVPPIPPTGFTLDNLLVGVPSRNNKYSNNISKPSLRESNTTTFTDQSSAQSPIDTSPPLLSQNSNTNGNNSNKISLSMSLNNNNNTSLSIPSCISLPTSPTPPNINNPAIPSLKLSATATTTTTPKPFIPKLVFPTRIENSAKMTRSSRRRDDTSSTRSVPQNSSQQTDSNSTKELGDLATKLGETYMTTDLTALISYKQSIDAHISTSSKRSSYAPKKFETSIITTTNNTTSEDQLSHNNLYKVRCDILKTVISSTYDLYNLQKGSNPINMLYSEAILIHKGIIPSNRDHLKLFYQLASNWGDYVEYIHRIRWKEDTKHMSSERKSTFRKKLDLFLYRINLSITNMLDTNQFDDMEYQLCVLSEYLEHCPTRIISSQVVDVCIESLLKLKHQIFKGKISQDRLKDIHIVHYLLCVFDEIIGQNMHPPLNELLLAIFIERDDTFNFIKHYTIQILGNENIEKEFTRLYSNINPKKLSEFRCRAIKHHSICVDMLKRNCFDYQNINTFPNVNINNNININNNNQNNNNSSNNSRGGGINNSNDSPDLDHCLELLKKMEYLLVPQSSGVILPFLQSSQKVESNFDVKITMLEFLSKIFMFKRNPFTKKKIYIDSYISYIYISFIKLYNNNLIDSQILTLCKLFLDVLLAFSVNKNDKISMKFYQLRTMDFLVREINLEYEVKQNREQFKPTIPFFSTPTTLSPIIQSVQINNNNNNPTINNSSVATTTLTQQPSPFKIIIPPLSGINSNNSDNGSSGNTTPPVSTTPNQTTPIVAKGKPSLPLLKLPIRMGSGGITTTTSSITPSNNLTPINTTPTIISTTPLLNTNNNNNNNSGANSSASSSTNNTSNVLSPITIPQVIIPPLINISNNEINNTIPNSTTTKVTVNTEILPTTTTTPSTIFIAPTSTATSVSTNKPPTMMKIAIPKLVLPAFKLGSLKTEDQKNNSSSASVPSSGVLSQLEQKVNLDPHDPKFQLVLDNPIQSLKSIQEQPEQQSNQNTTNTTITNNNNNNNTTVSNNNNTNITTTTVTTTNNNNITNNENLNENQRYNKEKSNRKLYYEKDLQISIIQLIFSLLLNSNQTLEHLYSDQFPLVAKKLNVPFILHHHINHPDNEKIIPELTKITHEMGQNYFRLLKLLFNKQFHSNLFKDLKRVAKGAYGTVYKGSLGNDEGLEIAVKLMQVPKTIHDRCVLYDIFTEILIMDTFRNDLRGCHMFDYGVDGENYWIVMKSYKCSLKEWRSKQTAPFLQQLPLYLNIYTNLLNTVQFLAENKVNHFDIKCDNFLIHPIKKGTIDEDFWNQPTQDPNFTVCLADWGEAKVYSEDIEGYTTRNRGTEFIKSPEMLTVAYASQKTRENFDRRKKVGSNTASDVWSLGCLFFELITGDFLFYEDDWVKFFIRVTQPGQELITPERRSKVANIPGIMEFLDYVFVRDQFYRPTLRDIQSKFTTMKPIILQQLEQILQQNPDGQLNTQQPKTFYNGGDGTRYKGTNRTGSSGHYTPGRFFPHTYNLSNPILSKNSQSNIVSILHDYQDNSSNNNPESSHEFPEHKFYMDNPSKITSYMYISSFHPSMNKNMLINDLHITHIINCTGSPNAYPDHFEYLHLQLHDDSSQDILHSLTMAFDFIRDAIMHHGKVLICSDKGVSRSAALAIGYFMDSRSISYFEAFILIRDRRYIISPNPGFVEQLCRWGKQRRTQKGLAEWGGGEIYCSNSTYTSGTLLLFQCLCGSCVFTLLTPFDSQQTNGNNNNTVSPNPKPCNCTKYQDNSCPNSISGCSQFLLEMKKLHNYTSLKYVLWGYTNVSNVVGDYNRSSIEVPNPNKQNKKEWILYQCKTCKFLTHALSTSINPGTNEKLIAIVTNLRTNQITLK